MSKGRVVEQGTHDELYAQDGMYRGLVDAQRISAESTGEGTETPEEITEMELIRNRSRSYSHGPDSPNLIRRTTTNRSSIHESKDVEAGVVEMKKYSLFYSDGHQLSSPVEYTRQCRYFLHMVFPDLQVPTWHSYDRGRT